MAVKGYHIISLEAKYIYEQEQLNGVEKGYELPSKNSWIFWSLFKNVLDFSLDLIELEKSYYKICKKKFSFEDEYKNNYTLAIINVKFNYKYGNGKGEKGLKELREYFYKHGFNLGGVHYVRYKRSSGSSRQGKCLFIDERLLRHMEKWGECELSANGNFASWEAYKSLSLSSLKGTIDIPLDGILFINDAESHFIEDVVSVEVRDEGLIAEKKKTLIKNNIWDGESLLDESLFQGEYADRHMLLLRNKFFKSCGFRTKLQKWIKDKNITLDELKARGFITFANDVSQIVMVTTPSSMKFLKFMGDTLTESNVRSWLKEIDNTFGVVKYDKCTKFFGGKMVQSSYQFINTLGINADQAEELLQPSIEYLTTIRNDYDFMRYHFTDAYKREKEDGEEDFSDGIAERSEVIFALMQINDRFKETKLYANFRNKVVESQKNRLKQGHILLPGTNATLFGNGPEMLLALSGEFDLHSTHNKSVVLASSEIACAKFDNNEKLACARSPHITMGNLYCVTNNLSNVIWDYFDLGENIVCVNAINENIQQRLNGCDYDSDAMLITNDKLIVETAFHQKDTFKVPVCNIGSESKGTTLAELDHNTSENKIGEIVNLSQKLNSILWDKIYHGENIQDLYHDICKLAVLSGIEIDKAKRAYNNVSAAKEIAKIAKKYQVMSPKFFQEIDLAFAKKKDTKKKDLEKEKLVKEYHFYQAPMEYVYRIASSIDFRKGKEKTTDYLAISDILKEPSPKSKSTVYDYQKKIMEICEEYKVMITALYGELREADDDEKDLLYARIRQLKSERNEKVKSYLSEEYVLYLVLKACEKEDSENWHLYAPLLESELFKSMLIKSKEKLQTVMESTVGEYNLYGIKFAKKY